MWQEGVHWAGGTVVDALLAHQSGEREIESIIIDPPERLAD